MAAGSYPRRSPHVLSRVSATQEWHDVTMLHWREDPARIAALLPDGLTPDLFDGSAWVSLVPFRMHALTLRPLPPVPVVGSFPETNIRTYVDGPHGPAVWFASLDVTRLFMVPTARTLFGVPYVWSQMAIARRLAADGSGEEIRYLTRRRWPGPRGATSLLGVRIGDPVDADPLDAFLANRWGAYATVTRLAGGQIRQRTEYTPVVHDPWPLREVTITTLHDGLGAAAGLPIGHIERARHARSVGSVAFGWPSLSEPAPR